jgi:hypothetical protein
MKRVAAAVVLALGVTSAAAAEPVTFGIGDVVYKHELKEPLPNAFGGRDIWGRKRTVGLIELRYIGMDGSVAVFSRHDTRFLTNETTVNRGHSVVGFVGDQTVMLSGVGAGPTVQALAPTDISIRVDLSADPTIVIDGATLKVLQASANKVIIDVPTEKKK